MILGSLCSGAGSLDMAVEHIFTAQTVWHCENDPMASEVLQYRWPSVPNHGDLMSTDWTQVEPVDIITAGWPCQPFSMAGKRKGAEDARAIWPHIARAVRILRPRIVALENVSAVLAAGEFQRAASDLAEIGYDLRWVCLRASDVGAPHRRERLFIYATSQGLSKAWPNGHGTAQSEHVSNHRSIADTNSAVCESGDGNAGRLQLVECGNQDRERRSFADAARDGWDEGWPESARLIGGFDAAVSGAGPVDLLPTPRTSDTNGAGVHGGGGMDLRTAISLQWGKYATVIRRWEQLTRPAPAPTELTRNGKSRLNPTFSEWMMGWPDGWVTQVPGVTRNDQLKIIGNGVVPQCAAAAFAMLRNN